MRLRQFSIGAAAAALGLLLATSGVQANTVLPGQSASADVFGAVTGTVMASTSGTWSLGSVATGKYVAEVVKDSSTGNMDFIYQVSNDATSTDDIEHLSAAVYTGWTTDMGDALAVSGLPTMTLPNPNIIPATTVDRNSAGDTVDFDFTAPTLGAGLLLPGTSTEYLVVKTNAKSYTAGDFNLIDNGTAGPIAAFAPAAPAPASLWGGAGLLGLMGILGVRRRRLMA